MSVTATASARPLDDVLNAKRPSIPEPASVRHAFHGGPKPIDFAEHSLKRAENRREYSAVELQLLRWDCAQDRADCKDRA